MTDEPLVALCVELTTDRATSADIPFHTTQIIDRISNLLEERAATAAANAQQANDRRAIGGWAFPTMNARKCHYFPANEDRSLCGNYALLQQDLRPTTPPKAYIESVDDCAACKRKVLAKIGDYYPEGVD